jgi:predicted nucleic acid-binding protein
LTQKRVGAIVDSSILFTFIQIGCLDMLISSFGHLCITPLLKKEITNQDQLQMIEKLIVLGQVVVLEPTADEDFRATSIFPKKAFNKEVSDTDREAVAVARCRGMVMLLEDTPMTKVARAAGLDVNMMFDTVKCLKLLVENNMLELTAALSHLEIINNQRTLRRHKALQWG